MNEKNIDELFDLFKESQDAIVSWENFDALLCQRLIGATNAQEASIWKMNDEGHLTLQYGTNISPEEIPHFSLRQGEGISGTALLRRKTISVNDAWTDRHHVRQVDETIHFRTRSMISSPIIFNDRLYGVINILNHASSEKFPEFWEHLMTAVGMLYATALVHRKKNGITVHLTSKTPMEQPGKTVVIGVSRAIQDVLDFSMKAAQSKVPVIIYGETGTGKELVARRIHEHMATPGGRFLSINCAALNETLLESELFGHVKGSFSGALANRKGKFVAASGGTLFLDEIGEMSLSCQVKILRALQEKKVMPVGSEKEISFDARIIAATNSDLAQLIRQQKFRQDLYFRLCGLELHLPKLCDRRSDIPILVDYFIQKGMFEKQNRIPSHLFPDISPSALDLMVNYSWPGNVRQLEQAVSAALAVCDNQTIHTSDLPIWLTRPFQEFEPGSEPEAVTESGNASVLDKVPRSEKKRYIQALHDTCYVGTGRWNVSAAARSLGIPRKTLVYRIKKMKISRYPSWDTIR